MLSKLKGLIFSLYIHVVGARFYSSETLPVKEPIRTLEVKTLHGYEISFSFYKESVSFTQYFFRQLKKRRLTIYAIRANFDHNAPEAVKKFNSVRIFVRDSVLFLSDESQIVMALLNVYLDYLLYEMQAEQLNEAKEVA